MKQLTEVNVLGTTYTIFKDVTEEDTTIIKDADGVTDFTTKKIFIAPLESEDDSFQDMERYEKRTIRHEIVHAILFESGLDHNAKWPRNEEMVDWLAIQFPKLLDIFKELKVETF